MIDYVAKFHAGEMVGIHHLSKEAYVALKKASIPDQKILRTMRIGSSTLTEFKKKHGLTDFKLPRGRAAVAAKEAKESVPAISTELVTAIQEEAAKVAEKFPELIESFSTEDSIEQKLRNRVMDLAHSHAEVERSNKELSFNNNKLAERVAELESLLQNATSLETSEERKDFVVFELNKVIQEQAANLEQLTRYSRELEAELEKYQESDKDVYAMATLDLDEMRRQISGYKQVVNGLLVISNILE